MNGYAPTPLVELPTLAAELRVGRVLVKDESARLGLPAFKILGVSWAVQRVLETRVPGALVTASDGNHGRALARVAAQHGLAARVYLPEGVHPAASAAIKAEGATVIDVTGSYDVAVAAAAADARANHGTLVQDTAWPGYEQIPGWIAEGYLTLFAELDDQLTVAPSLIIIPVGVGSLAQAAVTHYRRPGLSVAPALLTVEPDSAACLLDSLAHDEMRTVATGTTIMTGLNCGTLSRSAWPATAGRAGRGMRRERSRRGGGSRRSRPARRARGTLRCRLAGRGPGYGSQPGPGGPARRHRPVHRRADLHGGPGRKPETGR